MEPAEAGPAALPDAGAGIDRLQHVVVIVLENWSFDSLYGEFAGADGLNGAGSAAPQIDAITGTAYAMLPQIDPALPNTLANAPFALDPYISVAAKTDEDLTQKFYQEQLQIHAGKMDQFVSFDVAKGLAMGYFHTADLPLAAEVKKYVLCDRFFHAAYGSSFLNHMWLVAASTPVFTVAPDSMRATVDDGGHLIATPEGGPPRDGPVTPDGFAVNTVYSVNTPHPPGVAAGSLLPNQTMPTIGDRLSEKGLDWAWYAGGWNNALAGQDAGELFQYQHHPFVYFANYADGTAAKAAHLKDEAEFMNQAAAGTLPAVSFVKPAGVDNEHPNYANLLTGEQHVLGLINAVRSGPNWKDTAIIITYDENGGFGITWRRPRWTVGAPARASPR